MKILITVCARGGSKGIKDKNIREIEGKPLIAYTLDVARKWGKAARVICSTDSEKIATAAKQYGAEVPFIRPPELASDSAGKVGVIRHALSACEEIYGEKYDLVVDLDVTSPLRTVNDLDNCLELYQSKKPDILFSVVPARRSPYFNMVELQEDGFVELSKRPAGLIMRRQDAPTVYDMNASVYFYGRSFLLDSINTSPLSGKKKAVYVMPEISSFDIDSERDLQYVEYLLTNKVFQYD